CALCPSPSLSLPPPAPPLSPPPFPTRRSSDLLRFPGAVLRLFPGIAPLVLRQEVGTRRVDAEGPLEAPARLLEHGVAADRAVVLDRKSTRLNSSHVSISYAVFCLKKTTISALE